MKPESFATAGVGVPAPEAEAGAAAGPEAALGGVGAEAASREINADRSLVGMTGGSPFSETLGASRAGSYQVDDEAGLTLRGAIGR